MRETEHHVNFGVVLLGLLFVSDARCDRISSVDFQSRLKASWQCRNVSDGGGDVFSWRFSYGRLRRSGRHRTRRDIGYWCESSARGLNREFDLERMGSGNRVSSRRIR